MQFRWVKSSATRECSRNVWNKKSRSSCNNKVFVVSNRTKNCKENSRLRGFSRSVASFPISGGRMLSPSPQLFLLPISSSFKIPFSSSQTFIILKLAEELTIISSLLHVAISIICVQLPLESPRRLSGRSSPILLPTSVRTLGEGLS